MTQVHHSDSAQCSFCMKDYTMARPLAEGPEHVFICYECTLLCASLIAQECKRRGMTLPSHSIGGDMKATYEVTVECTPSGVFVARCSIFPNILGNGKTVDESLAEIKKEIIRCLQNEK